ncbi:hypothetical protein NEAUS03_0339 [Nematocida ausubeli]|nr:hypothetical protein NEAUS03_0339 [Nematocida ausubeli]
MQTKKACIIISMCIFIYQVCGRSHKHKSDDDIDYLIEGQEEKEGILISTFAGPDTKYIAIKNRKVVVVDDPKDANLFDIDLPTKESTPQEIMLEPWVEGKKHVIESDSLGDGLNVEIPIESGQKTESNLMIIREVVAKNAFNPVFEIVSAIRKKCFSIDGLTSEISLQACSNGSNDMRMFVFTSMREALKNEANKRGGGDFSMPEFTANTRVPSGTLIVGSSSGVLYSR